MGEKKEDATWDFKVPESNKERIQNRVNESTPSSKNSILDPQTAGSENKQIRKKRAPEKKLRIDNQNGLRKKRVSRSKLASQYEYEDQIQKLKRTSPIERIVAGTVDLGYLGIIVYGAEFLIPLVNKEYMNYLVENGMDQTLHPDTLYLNIWYAVCLAGFTILYFIPTMMLGKSIGKSLRGIRIGKSKDGGCVNKAEIFIREFLLRPISLISVVGVLLMFFNKERQGLHDKILKTSVFPD